MAFQKCIVAKVLVIRVLGREVGEVGSCADQVCGAEVRASKRWWESAEIQNFRSQNVIEIGTLNFNQTVTHFRNQSLFVAFYDPRSESFRELQGVIEDTADALARMKRRIGYFGAIDVTVHSYLAQLEAPQLQTAWQDPYAGPFRFERPRFYPLIILRYRDGKAKEYKDVVRKENLLDFLAREMVPKGAVKNSLEELDTIFRRTPGPFVLSCLEGAGAVPEEAEEVVRLTKTFEAAAQALSGEMVFAQATLNLCSSLRDDLKRPSVLYIRKSAARTTPPLSASVQSSSTVLLNEEQLIEWLSVQRPELLQEITPDNSWVFMERREPLVIFMVDAQDSAGKRSGEAFFGEIEHHLEAKYFQLVWADCKAFSEDFGIQKCPAVLVVDTEDPSDPSLRAPQLPWQELMQPKGTKRKGWASATSASERLRLWLEEQTVAIRKRMDGEDRERHGAPSKDDGKHGLDKSVEDIDWANDWYIHVLNVLKKRKIKLSEEGTKFHVMDSVGEKVLLHESLTLKHSEEDPTRFPLRMHFQEEGIHDDEADASEDFMNEWEDITEATGVRTAYEIYQAILMHMTLLRRSFQEVYGGYLPFDFSTIDRAQALHKQMRLLVSNTEDVEEILRNTSYRLQIWRSIENRLRFLEDLETMESVEGMDRVSGGKGTLKKGRITSFKNALREGTKLLRGVFRSVYEMLHLRAKEGTLVAPQPLRDVPRRAAENLSLKEFVETYAKPGLPVIITGLNVTPKEDWTLPFFRSRCNVSVKLRRRNPKSKSWGRLEDAGRLHLADFIDSFTSNSTRRKWYLHDWSLPRHCPEAFGPPPFEGFTIPKYFAGDYFQRAGFESYQHSWPSLFVGSNETQSSMHIDSGNTHFMLHLLSGRKEWRFYRARDLINLYMSPLDSRFHYDVFRPDDQKFPLSRYAEQFLGIQEAGDTIFIPAANPHAVRNLEHIHGISMNYVDASNVKLSILERIWELEGGDVELYTDGVSIPHGLVSEQRHLSFGEWKAQDWKRTKYDLF